jgi:hypothetical protein
VSAAVSDSGGGGGAINVTVLYMTNAFKWNSVALPPASGNLYQGTVQTDLNNSNVVALIQARDSAGNVSVQALKGTLSDSLMGIYLPLLTR